MSFWFTKKQLEEQKEEYVLKRHSERYINWARGLDSINAGLKEQIELLELRIKKLENVNLPVIVHCNCKKD